MTSYAPISNMFHKISFHSCNIFARQRLALFTTSHAWRHSCENIASFNTLTRCCLTLCSLSHHSYNCFKCNSNIVIYFCVESCVTFKLGNCGLKFNFTQSKRFHNFLYIISGSKKCIMEWVHDRGRQWLPVLTLCLLITTIVVFNPFLWAD